ncbi:HAMP domain-containing protein [Iocasia frigidifontis]|uniref:HAMP domain-containing protein n=1 Tax=Iocasia fonsfrigidae TaxID=2682810 RepID=A0A8A7KD47_9FIRM|nr:sensor histidine kinase [Iocasia fonsfrigidae]QTL99180.1 HAMP domain-containing protein [Iocasia fonsfrigidae]
MRLAFFKRFLELFYNKIRGIKIHYRLIILFLLLSLLPMLVTSIFSYQESSEAIYNKINTYSTQVVNQVSRNIMVELDRLEYDTIEIGFSDRVQDVLLNYNKMTEWEMHNAEYNINNTLVKKFSFLHDVSDVLIYTNDNKQILAYGDTGFKLKFKDEYLVEYLSEIRDRDGAPVWRGIDSRDEKHMVDRVVKDPYGIIVGRAIKSLYQGDIIGVIMIRTNESFFSKIYSNIDIGDGAEIFVMDSNGKVVSSRSPTIPINELYKSVGLVENIKVSEENLEDNTFNMTIDGSRQLIAYSPIKHAPWYLVSTIPYKYLNMESGRIGRKIIILGLVCFVLAALLSILFTDSISNPLRRLIRAMDEVKKGNLTVSIADNNRDEIAEVASNFDVMVKEIQNLLQDIKFKEKQKRDAEFKALQAQINPHFLSNILNTARVLANVQKADNLESLLTSLIELLHLSMDQEEDFITVRKEIDYLKNYINIQQYRLYNKFQVNFDIDEELLDKKLPKFLLQPVIENSIIHGIGPKKGSGIIEVKGIIYNNKMLFTITDDGVGMSKETIYQVLSGDDSHKGHFSGIGINNVQERIKLYFGDEYGIEIDSFEDYFTTVVITLPVST